MRAARAATATEAGSATIAVAPAGSAASASTAVGSSCNSNGRVAIEACSSQRSRLVRPEEKEGTHGVAERKRGPNSTEGLGKGDGFNSDTPAGPEKLPPEAFVGFCRGALGALGTLLGPS